MATEGIEGVYVETRNWGKTARFLQELGFDETTDVIGGFVAWAAAGLPVER